jgi:hypothetical protein
MFQHVTKTAIIISIYANDLADAAQTANYASSRCPRVHGSFQGHYFYSKGSFLELKDTEALSQIDITRLGKVETLSG